MPTLDDTPTIELLTSAAADLANDLILVYDVSEGKIKAMKLSELKTELA
jgi:6-phosphogluconolactonase (cycloisomerase 2 family)